MKKIILSLVIILSCNLNCIAADYNSLNKMYLNNINQAKHYETKGNIKESNEYYKKADKIFPTRFESSFGLAKTYGWLGNYQTAEAYYKRLLIKEPNNILIKEQYAYFLRDKGAYNTALKELKDLALATKSKKYDISIAEIYYLKGQYEKAISLLTNVPSKNNAVLKLLANSYFNKADYKNAKLYFEKYLLLNNSTEEQINYAKSLFYTGETLKAKNILEKLTLDDNISTTLADINLSLGDFKKSADILERLIQVTPSDIGLKIKYSNALMALNEFEKANNVLSELILLKSDNKEILNLYVDSCFALGKFDKAEASLSKARNLFPDDTNLKIKLVKSLESQGNLDKIGEYISDLENINPKNPEIYDILGNYYSYKKEFDKALSFYHKSQKEKPTDEKIFKVAEVYRFQNNLKNAEENYRSLVNSEKYVNKAKTKLAYIKLQQGKLDEAKEMFKELSLKENNQDALIGLAEVNYLKEDYLSSIKITEKINDEKEKNLLLAKNYNKLLKGSTALDVLKGETSKDAAALKAEIERENVLKIEPIFSLGNKNGNINQNITSQSYGFNVSKTVLPDIKLYSRFDVTPYHAQNNKAKGTVTSYSLGSSGKIGLKTDYLGEITLGNFSNGGQEVFAKSLVDYRLSDNWKIKTGYIRSLVDETMLSTTGLIPVTGPFQNQLVGRVMDNKFIFNTSVKLPYDSYFYSGYNLGFKKGKNSEANPYQEIMGGIGKLLYTTDENKLLCQVLTGYNIYYTGYKNNKLNYGGASLEGNPLGSDGRNINNTGGYFSPDGIIVNNISFKLKGAIKPLNLKYQNESFVGVQNIKNEGSDLSWGNTISLIWNEKGRIGIKLGYNTNFYGVAKHQNFFVQLLFRDLLRKQKCSEFL